MTNFDILIPRLNATVIKDIKGTNFETTKNLVDEKGNQMNGNAVTELSNNVGNKTELDQPQPNPILEEMIEAIFGVATTTEKDNDYKLIEEWTVDTNHVDSMIDTIFGDYATEQVDNITEEPGPREEVIMTIPTIARPTEPATAVVSTEHSSVGPTEIITGSTTNTTTSFLTMSPTTTATAQNSESTPLPTSPSISKNTTVQASDSASTESAGEEDKNTEDDNPSSSTSTVILSLLVTVLIAVMLMVVCTKKKLFNSFFETDIINSIPASIDYRVIHKTERMVESLSKCTLEEDKSKLEFHALEALTKELVEPNSMIREGLNLRNRNRYTNIIPYDKNIVRLNKKIGKTRVLAMH